MPAAKSYAVGIGLQTAANIIGDGTTNFEYDGTNWTAGSTLNTGRNGLGGSGITTAGLVFGGRLPSPLSTKTETYDGTSFTETADLATARAGLIGGMVSPNSQSLAFGGGTPSSTGATEEFNVSVNTITAAAFSSGGSMGTGRYGGNYFGTGKDSQVAAGGHISGSPDNTANSETYNGTTWSEGNNLNTSRYNAAGGGTETAGIVATGRNPSANPSPQVRYGNTEEYNGTSYSEVTDCPEASYRKVGAGTQTALMICGGLPPSYPPYANTSFEYDGTNWTAGGAMPQQGNYMDGVGVTTAAVVFGAINSPSPNTNNACLDYDGSSFSANNNMNINHGGQHFVSGTVTDAIVGAGGAPYAVAAQSETYDGTTFATNATLATEGQRGGKGTTTAAAFAVGGHPPFLAVTEEYTVESTAVNAKTLTTS